jgi:ABC-2 type transport system ATP-binding protein
MTENTKPEIIRVDHLVKTYGAITAVNDISFTVAPGEIFAFLGPNGAGKSTSIKMLTTLLRPTSGGVYLNGYDVLKEPAAARKSFGIVFQDPSVDIELTGYENLKYHALLYDVPRAVYQARIDELLALVDLSDRRNDYVKIYSGGMKRRLEIARGLLHHPKVFFLDEPTLGLDPQTRNHIWTYIKELNKKEGITIFFTTHYMDEADRMAGRIAIIDNGSIVAMGPSEELKQKTGAATLEEAFLSLTGKQIREEEAGARAQFRDHARAWGRR